MTLKAQCVDGTIVDVKVSDCPVRIDKNITILANVPMSKLVYDCSLKRCEGKYVEYSYVFGGDYQLIGYLLYKSGWKLLDKDTNKFSELRDEYTFAANQNIKLIDRLQKLTDPITFTVGNETFNIRSIIGSYEGKCVLYVNGVIKYIYIGSENEVTIQ